MWCPNCQEPVTETLASCNACGFSLSVADEWFGSLPKPGPGLIDAAEVLSPIWRQRIELACERLQQKFPQVTLHALTVHLPAAVGLVNTVFWLFNRGGFCRDEVAQRGGNNHAVLLVLDVTNERVACMLGYGLEPFVPDGELDQLAAGLQRLLTEEGAAVALERGVSHLQQLLTTMQRRSVRGFGLAGQAWPGPAAGSAASNS